MNLWNTILQQQMEDGAPAGEDGAAAPEPETQSKPEPTAAEQELAALKEENARLKAQPAPHPAPATNRVPTSADLEGYTDEQWAIIEERTKKDRTTILRDYKDFELTNRQNAIDAKTNTTEALQDAIEANPKLTKLRGSIKEFMDDVPQSDKLDPAKLKRHMERAVIYAKGKHMTTIPDAPTPKPKPNDGASPKGGNDDDEFGADGLAEGEIKNDEYVSATGLRIKTGKVNKEVWSQIKHKTKDPNSISIPIDFDKPPAFSK